MEEILHEGYMARFGIPGHLAEVVDGVRFLVHLHRHKFEAACSLCWIQQRRPGSARKKDEKHISQNIYTLVLWHIILLINGK